MPASTQFQQELRHSSSLLYCLHFITALYKRRYMAQAAESSN